MRFFFASASFFQCAIANIVQLLYSAFVVNKLSTMTKRTNEESFNVLYAKVLSDCPSDCESNCGDLENDTASEDSESDIRPLKYH